MTDDELYFDTVACRELLALARLSIEGHLSGAGLLEYVPARQELCVLAGAFVTLHRGPDLRGCIGHLQAEEALFRTVQRCAVSAATEDLRFRSVTLDELPWISVEISVLSPLRRVGDPREVEVGRHGIVIARGGRRGVLLPQVAVEHDWGWEMFLSQTCRKAGLPLDAWRDASAEIHVFTAQIFGEDYAAGAAG